MGRKFTLLLVSSSHLSQVAVVISFHFQIEDLALCSRGFGNEIIIQETLQQKTYNCNSKLSEKSRLPMIIELQSIWLYLQLQNEHGLICILSLLA